MNILKNIGILSAFISLIVVVLFCIGVMDINVAIKIVGILLILCLFLAFIDIFILPEKD